MRQTGGVQERVLNRIARGSGEPFPAPKWCWLRRPDGLEYASAAKPAIPALDRGGGRGDFFHQSRLDRAWDMDEALYASCAREMFQGGPNWVVPMFNGQVFVEKPPLMFWTMMAGFTLFGDAPGSAEFAARFFSALHGRRHGLGGLSSRPYPLQRSGGPVRWTDYGVDDRNDRLGPRRHRGHGAHVRHQRGIFVLCRRQGSLVTVRE